jgi:branched-chain amino acid transport system substrate-binding protein
VRRISGGVLVTLGAVVLAACSSGPSTPSARPNNPTTTTSFPPTTTTTTTKAAPTTTSAPTTTTTKPPVTTTTGARVATTTTTKAGGSTTTTTSGSKNWSGKTITFGAVFSITGSGEPYGRSQVQGVNLALDQINAAGGINGAHLNLSISDDASDPSTAAANMTTLANRGALAVLGPTFTNSAYVADPVANMLSVPVLAVSNTGPGIVGNCSYPCTWIFRDSLGEATGIPVNVDTYLGKSHPKKAVVIAPSGDAYGAQTGQLATTAFTAAGVSAGPPVIVPVTEPALGQAVAAALASKPGVLMVTASSPTVASGIITDARKSAFTGGILGGNAFNSPAVAKAAGSAGRNAQSSAGWYAGDPSPTNTSFVSSYRSRYGAPPDQFAAQAFTGVKLLAAAAKNAPLGFTDVAADRAAFKVSLEAVSLQTPLGPFRFTAEHDVYQPVWVVAMNGRGGYRLVTEVPPAQTQGTTSTTSPSTASTTNGGP